METYPTRINAVITCGGNSLRMGESKALLHYHGMPQYKWVLQLCKQLGIDAAVSCKKAHQEWFDKETILIFDDIHWSAEMEKAWAEIKANPSVTLTIDLFFIGLVFVRKAQKEKEHFIIRY